MEDFLETFKQNDQGRMTKTLREHPELIALDTSSRVFSQIHTPTACPDEGTWCGLCHTGWCRIIEAVGDGMPRWTVFKGVAWRPEAVNMCREEPRPLILHGAGPGKKHLLGDIIPA